MTPKVEFICSFEIGDFADVKGSPKIESALIRCKDCKFHYYHDLLKQDYCDVPANIQFGEIDPEGWCYLAERKEE